MTAAARPASGTTQERITAIVASLSRRPAQWISQSCSFASLGFDSLGVVQLLAAIEDELVVKLPLSAAREYQSIEALARFIEHGGARAGLSSGRETMLADAVLPVDIQPRPGRSAPVCDARDILLTGATGFLGAYLLRALLDETQADIHCGVRSHVDGRRRIFDNLEEYDLARPDDDARIHVIRADLSQPMLGMSDGELELLADGIDAIYHCGAAVNWVYSYEELRDANVLGTRDLLRLACAGSKPVHFISSVSVCHSTSAPADVDETLDALTSIDGLHLGYAQSKCVAEALVRQAAARGIPATIIRPSLVTGDARTGRSNADDLTSRLVAGCIRMGVAPDLDWRMDCVPVDETARAIVRLTGSHSDGLAVSHLTADQPRHWRECVLWMRLVGYDVELLPYAEWLERVVATREFDHPLFPLRAFFATKVADEGLTLPELFEESQLPRIAADATRAARCSLGAPLTAVGPSLLSRYFDEYVARGLIPAAPRRGDASTGPATLVSRDALATGLSHCIGCEVAVRALDLEAAQTDESIVAELTAWRGGPQTGLMRGVVSYVDNRGAPGTAKIFIKSKASDEQSIDVAESLGGLLSPNLGREIAKYRDRLGITRSHLRELAIYSDSDPRMTAYRPVPLAIERDDAAQHWVLALEAIDEAVLINALSPAAWSDEAIDAALYGIAQIHARWLIRDVDAPTLYGAEWLPPLRDAASRTEMMPLWRAFAEHAALRPAWRAARLRTLHGQLVRDVASWSRELDAAPRTLIHNDFNPRNIAIRRRHGRLTLCAFDWELATVGPPQRDLAEFLCFVLRADAPRDAVRGWVERSRLLFSEAAGVTVARDAWERGFSAALCDLLVDRLAMLAMIDRVRPQRFLPRVTAAWLNVFDCFPRS